MKLDVRFDHDPEGSLPLSVEEPIDQVAGHFGCRHVQLKHRKTVHFSDGVNETIWKDGDSDRLFST